MAKSTSLGEQKTLKLKVSSLDGFIAKITTETSSMFYGFTQVPFYGDFSNSELDQDAWK